MRTHASPRARDFYDIFETVRAFRVDVATEENRLILERMFAAKRVPLRLIGMIEAQREFHRVDFPSVLATVPAGQTVHGFDVYFDFALEQAARLKPLWDKQPPV